MRKSLITMLLFCGLLYLVDSALADNGAALLVRAVPDRSDHLYGLGRTAEFDILVSGPSAAGGDVRVRYRFSVDGEVTLEEGESPIEGGRLRLENSLNRPGFLRLDLTAVSGSDTARTTSAVGFDPAAIRPTNVLPDDFERFWRASRAELARVPLDERVERIEEEERPGAAHYLVSLSNVGGTRVFGRLAVPEGEGPFPAVLVVPGAGVSLIRPGAEYIRAGFVTLAIDVHGIPQDRGDRFYQDLREGVLAGYQHFGNDDPYQFYYRRVILGCIRAIDYLASRPDVDSTRLAIAGSSQGGALSLLTAGLDKRIKALVANVPAMCDHTGSLFGRPSGWPRLLRVDSRESVRRTSAYYDAALNAGFITVPTRVAVGFIDGVCAPTTVYAAFNNLKGPKVIDNFPEMGHSYAEGWLASSVQWLRRQLDGQ